MAKSADLIERFTIVEGVHLLCTPRGNVLFGCPPEILKRLLPMHLPMPDVIVLPQRLYSHHSTHASLEFPLYHFLFVQRGLERKRHFQVIAQAHHCESLEQMLRVTLVGPNEEEMTGVGCDPQLAQEIYQETSSLALKNSDKGGRPFLVDEIVHFKSTEKGGVVEVYPATHNKPALMLENLGECQYRLNYGEDATEVDVTITQEISPSYPLNHRPFKKEKGKFTMAVLGRSNGFDPKDPANGYLFNIDGKFLLWDSPAYLHHHLRNLQVDPKDIDALIVSHVHEDHLDVQESLRETPFDLYTTPEIYYSILIKLMAVHGYTMEQAKACYNWRPLKAETDTKVLGAECFTFHAIHAIPALGCRLRVKIGRQESLIHISGDHVSKDVMKSMMHNKGLSKRRYRFFQELVTGDEDMMIMDAGGGMIHGDYRDYLTIHAPIAYMHTGLIQEDLPENKHLMRSGQVYSFI